MSRDDYWPLCRPCHKTYDTSDDEQWALHFSFAHQITAVG